MLGPVVVAVAALAGVAIEWWVLIPGSLSPRLLRPGCARRLVRRVRAVGLRAGAAMLSWPRALDVLFGVRRDQPGSVPLECVWSEGRARLWRNAAARTGWQPPVLVVHSVVTHPWILDLAPGMSLVGALAEQGLDVWVLDWGVPDSGETGIEWYIERLLSAEAVVASESGGGGRVHLVGYCAGGLVVLERLRRRGVDPVATVSFVATPADLHRGTRGIQRLLISRRFRPALVLDGRGLVPAPVVRESFHLLRPEALRAIWRRWRRRSDPAYRHRYAAMGRWLWEQIPLPGTLLFDLVALARENPYVRGWQIPERLPVLAVVAERDHIVPIAAALAISAPAPHADVIRIAAGHVAMVAGPATAEWLAPAIRAHVGPRRQTLAGHERP